ncbi:hypothetical protein OJF2_23550 [Aquisphaera giovannonii]|uniref:Uncharacterized protein n=1 Tax=Aquisphaera giovannonii TaxID=406548 RepID=A0A5B9W1E5_9BACT|nr:hypothetical protein [Aquisphaera giovannonii]QEH33825.1 hypothetical protein OJF2_23550 [Aquisphaera giovannonii]
MGDTLLEIQATDVLVRVIPGVVRGDLPLRQVLCSAAASGQEVAYVANRGGEARP